MEPKSRNRSLTAEPPEDLNITQNLNLLLGLGKDGEARPRADTVFKNKQLEEWIGDITCDATTSNLVDTKKIEKGVLIKENKSE